jgi:hypothetical protein
VLVMKRLRAVVRQRGIVVKTLFRDYDRSRNGFVTRSQFRQSLPPLFGLTDAEAKMIMQKWVVAVDARWYGGQFGGRIVAGRWVLAMFRVVL